MELLEYQYLKELTNKEAFFEILLNQHYERKHLSKILLRNISLSINSINRSFMAYRKRLDSIAETKVQIKRYSDDLVENQKLINYIKDEISQEVKDYKEKYLSSKLDDHISSILNAYRIEEKFIPGLFQKNKIILIRNGIDTAFLLDEKRLSSIDGISQSDINLLIAWKKNIIKKSKLTFSTDVIKLNDNEIERMRCNLENAKLSKLESSQDLIRSTILPELNIKLTADETSLKKLLFSSEEQYTTKLQKLVKEKDIHLNSINKITDDIEITELKKNELSEEISKEQEFIKFLKGEKNNMINHKLKLIRENAGIYFDVFPTSGLEWSIIVLLIVLKTMRIF